MTTATRNREFWTTSEVSTLRQLAKKKTPAPKIAKHLKRTISSVRQKALSIGLSLDSRIAKQTPRIRRVA